MGGKTLGGRKCNRDDVLLVIEELKKLKFFDLCEKYEICGSYRRGKKEDMSDIDIVFIPKDIENYKQWFDKLELKKAQTRLIKKVLINGIEIDLFQADESSYVTMKMMWTGSRGFNLAMRGKMIDKGYVYTSKGIFKDKTYEKIEDIKEEKDIFKLIDIEYIDPGRR